MGGNIHDAGALFFQPTIITNCNNEMLLSKEEIFGPVSSIFMFDTEADAIEIANINKDKRIIPQHASAE